jgi:uncharacterized membrane protein YhfC
MQTSSLNMAVLAAQVAAILFAILYPLALAVVARRRLGVGWRFFGYGALIFFLFQLISRVPLMQGVQSQIAPQLQASRALLIAWLVTAAVTAALFEEIGRYIGYRWLMRNEEKTWPKAIMYGIGHGGIESILLVGGLMIVGLINMIVLPNIPLDTIPEAQRAQVQAQIAALQNEPAWLPLLGAWERLWTLPIQIAFSVIVLQVFRRGSLRWLWLAIAGHTLVDLSVALPALLNLQGTGATLLVEGIVTLFGIAALWVIWRLRDAVVTSDVTISQYETPS